MAAKDSSLRTFVVGDVLRAAQLNSLQNNVGAVGYLAPWNVSNAIDSAGVVFLGTTAYPLAGFVLTSNYKIFSSDGVNTTTINLGGDNTGHLGIIENKSEIERNGFNNSISERFSSSESFTNRDNPFDLKLGRNYGTGDLTLMYLHNDYRALSKCNALGDGTGTWTSLGAQASAATVGGTNSIEGGASIHTTVSATTGENGLRFSFGTSAINISNGKVRFGLFLNTLSNISTVKTLLADSTGTANSAFWNLTAQASGSALVAGAWNYMEANIQGTSSGGNGSLNLGSVKEVHVLITPSSSQAFNMDVDDVCSVSKYEIDLPATYQIADSSNTQIIYLNSGANGAYQLGTSVVNNYAITTTDVKKRMGTVFNGQYVLGLNNTIYGLGSYYSFPTGTTALSGNAAKEVWDIKTEYFESSITNKDFTLSQRFFTPTYLIINVPSANSITLKTVTGTGDVNSFVTGGELIAFQKKWIGNKFVSPNNASWGNNFKLFNITGSSTVSGTSITVNTVESTTGLDANAQFFVVNNVAQNWYAIGADSSSGVLTKSDPTSFMPLDQKLNIRGLTTLWKLTEGGGNAIDAISGLNFKQVGTVPSAAGIQGLSRGPFSTSNYFNFTKESKFDTPFDKTLFAFGGWFRTSGGAGEYIFENQNANDGFSIRLDNTGILRFNVSGTSVTTTRAYDDGKWHHFFCGLRAASGTAEQRIYIDGKVQDSTSVGNGVAFVQINIDMGIGIAVSGGNTLPWLGQLNGLFYIDLTHKLYSWADLEDFILASYNNGRGFYPDVSKGFITKTKVTPVTGSKLTTATRLIRADTTNQSPIVFERNAILT